jgi:hypothetical protein
MNEFYKLKDSEEIKQDKKGGDTGKSYYDDDGKFKWEA